MSRLQVDVWSDIACPWCYVGKRRLEAALERFPHRDEVDVVWHAFELDPGAPKERDRSQSYAERLAKKYGRSVAQAHEMLERMAETARGDGLDLRFDQVRSGSTFDAHRLVHLGLVKGKQDAVKERLFAAYMTEGELISDPSTLVRIAGEAGLSEDDASAMLASDTYASEVRRDESVAGELGVSGVPFYVLGGKYAVSGAQPAELFHQALERAWEEIAEKPEGALPEGAVCGPDGC
jgi:predicted DsbA family dithiol-disulfide isomerase